MATDDGVDDINRLAVDLTQASVTSAVRAGQVIRKTGQDVVRDAQTFVPVDTGNLKNSIGVDYDRDGLGFEAGPTANYGGYVEFGTTRMAPHAYMGPAFDRRVPAAVQALEQLGGKVLED